MTPSGFRKLACNIPLAVESSHMQHPDFRIGGKIFATLGYPDGDHGMVKLTPVQQRTFMKQVPGVFTPCAGAWGRQGCTNVYLPSVDESVLAAALAVAAKNLTTTRAKGKSA